MVVCSVAIIWHVWDPGPVYLCYETISPPVAKWRSINIIWHHNPVILVEFCN
jgi:hypothetical protein